MIELRRRIMVSIGSGTYDYPQGIWAYYADGSIRNYETADSNAIGVALITNNVAFVIDKQLVSTGTYPYGGGRINLDVVKQRKVWNDAKLDFDGNDMTTSLISVLSGATDHQGVTGAPAAGYCRTRFGGNGYLGAGGEYQEIYDNKNDVNSMMSKIGGQQLTAVILTANPANPGYETENSIWTLNFNNGNGAPSTRDNNLSYVCALMPLTSSAEPIEPDGDFVDLGLPSGLLWAKGNITKDSQGNYSIGEPEDYGTYFSWGNIDGHNPGEGYNFNETTYNSTTGHSIGVNDDIPTNATYDAARARLGGDWKIPSRSEFQELISNTVVESGTLNSVDGFYFYKKVNGQKVADTYIFIPNAGRMNGTAQEDTVVWSNAWTSTHKSSQAYRYHSTKNSTADADTSHSRYYGCPIRACKSSI